MPAWKLIVALVVVGAIGLVGWAYVAPMSAPGPLKKWGLALNGVGPAKTPREALDKFGEQLKKRNYEFASLYLIGEYGQEFKLGATPGAKLAKAIDEMNHNIEVAGLNSDKSKLALGLLMPIPGEFKILKAPEEKEGQTTASAVLQFELEGMPARDRFVALKDFQQVDPKIWLSLYPMGPLEWNGKVTLKQEGDGWKIEFDLTQAQLAELREFKIKTLRSDVGNYVRALDNLKYDIKHNAATKTDLEVTLRRQLEEAKSK